MAASTNGRRIRGLAVPYETPALVGPRIVETVARGAFVNLDDVEITAQFQHAPPLLLGRTGAGTLRLFDNDDGLAFEIDPPDTGPGRDVLELIRRRDVRGASVGFQLLPDGVEYTEQADVLFTRIVRAELIEISIAHHAVYTQTKLEIVDV